LELALINFAADKAAPLFSEQFSLLGVALLGLKGRKSRIERRAFNLFAFFAHFAGISIIPPSFPAIVYFLEPRIEI